MSAHFSRAELVRSRKAVELNLNNEPPTELLPALDFTVAGCERIRAYLGLPMAISSGYRCYALNKAVGGASDSQHMKAEAVDFTCPAYGDPQEVFEDLIASMEVLGIDQIILESTWVHVSFTLTPRYQALKLIEGRYVPVIV